MSMDTIDFRRLSLQAGARILDLGCGEGRHALSAWLRAPVQVIGIDLSLQDLATARQRAAEFQHQPGADGHRLGLVAGSALQLPLANASIDGVICSEVLEHVFDYSAVIDEIHRVLRPGGWLAVSVPRAWPERLCWWLSDSYHETPGGHIRIFGGHELPQRLRAAGFQQTGTHGAHALHVPYWWLRCASRNPDASLAVRLWHRLLVWDLLRAPRLTRWLERLLNPLLGKSRVWYFQRPDGAPDS